MKRSKYQKKRIADERKKAVALYQQGFSSREVSQMLAKIGITMSHQTVMRAVRASGRNYQQSNKQ